MKNITAIREARIDLEPGKIACGSLSSTSRLEIMRNYHDLVSMIKKSLVKTSWVESVSDISNFSWIRKEIDFRIEFWNDFELDQKKFEDNPFEVCSCLRNWLKLDLWWPYLTFSSLFSRFGDHCKSRGYRFLDSGTIRSSISDYLVRKKGKVSSLIIMTSFTVNFGQFSKKNLQKNLRSTEWGVPTLTPWHFLRGKSRIKFLNLFRKLKIDAF